MRPWPTRSSFSTRAPRASSSRCSSSRAASSRRGCAARSRASIPRRASPQRTPAARASARRKWGEGTRLGHDGAIAHLVEFLRRAARRASPGRGGPPRRARRPRVLGAGAAQRRSASRSSRNSSRSRRCTSRTTSRRSAWSPSACRSCRRWPASTPRSIARSPRSRRRFALPASITDRGVRRYGFHGLSYEYIASALPAPRCRGRGRAA